MTDKSRKTQISASGRIPRATAVAIATACNDAGVPELTADLFGSVMTIDDAAERIIAAQAAKRVVALKPRERAPLDADRGTVTTEAATAKMRAQLERDGALPDWSWMGAAS